MANYILRPGSGNQAAKVVLDLGKNQVISFASLKEAAAAYHMSPKSFLESRSMREKRGILLVGVDITPTEARARIQISRLERAGFKKAF